MPKNQAGNAGAATRVTCGEVDPLVDPSGVKATATAIAGDRFKLVAALGHDLPSGKIGELVAYPVHYFFQGA